MRVPVKETSISGADNSVGNDLMTRRSGFPGLFEGCRWCLCVERWKEAMMASERLGPGVVPK